MIDDSPVARALTRLGLTSVEASVLSDVSPAAVSVARSGGPIPGRLLDAFARAGIDTEQLLAEQSDYRAARARQIEARVSSRSEREPSMNKMAACGEQK